MFINVAIYIKRKIKKYFCYKIVRTIVEYFRKIQVQTRKKIAYLENIRFILNKFSHIHKKSSFGSTTSPTYPKRTIPVQFATCHGAARPLHSSTSTAVKFTKKRTPYTSPYNVRRPCRWHIIMISVYSKP